LKDPLEVVVVDPNTGIRDDEFGDLVAVIDLKPDVAAIGEFDRVREKIDQNLPQPVLVGVHDRRQMFRRNV
jgi:hypothetical protein